MRRCDWILLSGFLLAMGLLEPACSQKGSDVNSGSTATAQGGSDDPGSSITGGRVDGATEPPPPGVPMNYQKAAVTNISELFNTNNPAAFSTRAAELSGVTVQQVFPDKHFIAVGSDKDHSLMVQMGELHPEIKAGQKVDIRGVINPTGHDISQWNVQPEEQQALAHHPIFLQERSIKMSGR